VVTTACGVFRRLVALVLVCAIAGPVATFKRTRIQVEDRTGDGRPASWRVERDGGRTVEIAVDTNDDGRPDQVDVLDRGRLVRRDIDSNFDGRVDIVENIDPQTHGRTRAIRDVDFDGTADQVELYRDGVAVSTDSTKEPVSSTVSSTVRAGQSGVLAPLVDPFRSRPAYDSAASDDSSDALAIVAAAADVPLPVFASALPRPGRTVLPRPALWAAAAPRAPDAPRGPPLNSLL